MSFPAHMRIFAALLCLLAVSAWAGPYVPAGDLGLRSDIQLLADHGIIKGPTSTWPLAWGPIVEDLKAADAANLSASVGNALARVSDRVAFETRSHEWSFNAKAAIADNSTRIRSFQNTPRGKIEVGAGATWIDDWFNIELNVQGVDSDQDDEEFRADDTMIGAAIGNWSIAASTQQRWWGHGWDGSIILANNARPIPAFVIDRVFPDAFESKWLSWIGPWDLNVMFGQLERERHIPNTQFFGMRVTFRPIPSLELGLSRTAQWCGDGRPCDAGTFVDLLLGKDNIGDAGVGTDNEPGNQMAGFDFRWSPSFFDHAAAFYGQVIGEDEAGGFPSRYLGQFGAEWSGYVLDRWSARVFAEFAGTSCQFHESSKLYNCGYSQSIYGSGYRYRGRPIGHGADNDAELISLGVVLSDAVHNHWRVLVRSGELNAGGAPDVRHSLTPTPQDIASIDISHSRVFAFGLVDVGVGHETIDDMASDSSFSDTRFYVQWRSAY